MSDARIFPVVVMLDQSDATLHGCSKEHLVTYCGIALDQVTVGPLTALIGRNRQFCTACWGMTETGLRLFDEKRPRFECPRCRSVSYNSSDISQGYCGNCHDWTRGEPRL